MWASAPTESYHGVRRGGALLPTVVPTDSRALSCPLIGALPRNRLASSATGGASPISPPAGDRKGRPYGGLQEVRWGEESPSRGFAVTAPFRQGGRGDGGTDCHDQFANWSRNDMVFTWGAVRWDDVGIVPYGSVTRNAPQVLAGGVEPRPYGGLGSS